MSRTTETDFSRAFRIVTIVRHRDTGVPSGEPSYSGPYQTKEAAKGAFTRMLEEYNGSGRKKTELTGWIEQTTETWERVE